MEQFEFHQFTTFNNFSRFFQIFPEFKNRLLVQVPPGGLVSVRLHRTRQYPQPTVPPLAIPELRGRLLVT